MHSLLPHKRLLTRCLLLVALQDQPLLWRSFLAIVTLSEGGAVATQTADSEWSLTTTETELTEGKHYWEGVPKNVDSIMIGISRPNLNPMGIYYTSDSNDGWFIHAHYGALFGNGKQGEDGAGAYKLDDRVGMLLDLDNGSLRFFKNGVQHGPGYAAGSVTGPVVHAVQLFKKGDSVRLLLYAEAPICN
jgi:hypothetical protein